MSLGGVTWILKGVTLPPLTSSLLSAVAAAGGKWASAPCSLKFAPSGSCPTQGVVCTPIGAVRVHESAHYGNGAGRLESAYKRLRPQDLLGRNLVCFSGWLSLKTMGIYFVRVGKSKLCKVGTNLFIFGSTYCEGPRHIFNLLASVRS